MTWAKAALASGLLVVVAAFAIGTENQLSTSVMGRTQDCGPAISASWLVSGTPDPTQPGSARTTDERRAVAACRPVVHQSRLLVVTVIGSGLLLALVGGSAIRARGDAPPRTVTPAHS